MRAATEFASSTCTLERAQGKERNRKDLLQIPRLSIPCQRRRAPHFSCGALTFTSVRFTGRLCRRYLHSILVPPLASHCTCPQPLPSPRDPRSCADSSTGQMHRPPLSPSSPPSRPPLLPLCPLLRPPEWQRPSQKLALEIAFEASSVREDQRACIPDAMRFN